MKSLVENFMPASECAGFDIRVTLKFQFYRRNRPGGAAEKQSIYKFNLKQPNIEAWMQILQLTWRPNLSVN